MARSKLIKRVAAGRYALKLLAGAAACATGPRYVKESLTRSKVLISS